MALSLVQAYYGVVLTVIVVVLVIYGKSLLGLPQLLKDRRGRIVDLECFYCGERSRLPGPTARITPSVPPGSPRSLRQNPAALVPVFDHAGRVSKWFCRYCDSWNVYDKHGEIESYVPEMRDFSSTPQVTAIKAAEHDDTGMNSDSIFCQSCVRRQTLLVDALSRYLPDDDDPDFEAKLADYENHRTYLEQRYPLACKLCSRRVNAELSRQEHRLKSLVPSLPNPKVSDHSTDATITAQSQYFSKLSRIVCALGTMTLHVAAYLGGALALGILMCVTAFSFLCWARLFYDGLFRGLMSMVKLALIGVESHDAACFPEGLCLTRPRAVWSCVISPRDLDEQCFVDFQKYRSQLILQTAGIAFAFAEFNEYLKRSRKTALRQAAVVLDGKGVIYAALVYFIHFTMDPTIVFAETRIWLRHVVPCIYLCLTIAGFIRAIKVLVVFFDPAERRQRHSLFPASVAVTAEKIGNTFQNILHGTEITPSLFDRSDSAVGDLASLCTSHEPRTGAPFARPLSGSRQAANHAQLPLDVPDHVITGISGLGLGPTDPATIGSKYGALDDLKRAPSSTAGFAWSERPTSLFHKSSENEGANRWLPATNAPPSKGPRGTAVKAFGYFNPHMSNALAASPGKSPWPIKMENENTFVSKLHQERSHEKVGDRRTSAFANWSGAGLGLERQSADRSRDMFPFGKTLHGHANQSNFGTAFGPRQPSKSAAQPRLRSPHFAHHEASQPRRRRHESPESHSMETPMLSPQTFFPQEQSTGLEDLFSSNIRLEDDNKLKYFWNTWLSSALNGHPRIAQRYLQLATPFGLFASWMVRY
ncbi:Ima1 N-terminal domain-containing protein [Powellomyces hirtus]|nr:Ima1 N-terminal domain-containing protein [Powellomyces hirtus]